MYLRIYKISNCAICVVTGFEMQAGRRTHQHGACEVVVSLYGVIRQIKCGLLPQIKNNFLRYAEALQSVLFATISAHCFM